MSFLAPRYTDLLERITPYVVTYPGNLSELDLCPWEIGLQEQQRISCLSIDHEWFFDLLHKLDGLTFGPTGMSMAKWVFFDCGEMPGAIIGFALPAAALPKRVRDAFELPGGFDRIVPVSMFIAIPAIRRGFWFAHNLSSISGLLGRDYRGLGLLTKVIGLKVMKISHLFGVTQWNSIAMNIHLQIADLQLESAYTPAHTFKNSLTYRTTLTDDILRRSLSGVRRKADQWDFLLPADDERFSISLQRKIEKGERFRIVGRAIQEKDQTFFPIVRAKSD